MAELSKNRKYITIDDVRASYDKKTGAVRISSTDEDFKSGFALTLNHGTHSHSTLVEVMKNLGVFESDTLQGTMWDISHIDFAKTLIQGTDDSIVFARGPHQRLISWNFRAHPHMLVAGGNRSGRTSALSSILASIHQNSHIKNPKFIFSAREVLEIETRFIDRSACRVEERSGSQMRILVKRILNEYETGVQVDADTFIFIDGFSNDDEKDQDYQHDLHRLLQLPKEARVHVILTCYSLAFLADDIFDAFPDAFTARLITGYSDGSRLIESEMMFRGQSVGTHVISRMRDMSYYITSDGMGCPVRLPLVGGSNETQNSS